MRMKRSEFKAMVKECVRECIREIMHEQINPSSLLESLGHAHAPSLPAVINPMDDYQMRFRQELIAQKMLQGQLQRQSMVQPNDPFRQPVVGLSELAGLDTQHENAGQRYLASGMNATGYLNPSDRLRAVDHAMNPRFNPQLDSPLGTPTSGRQRSPSVSRQNAPADNGFMTASDDALRQIFEDTARTTFQQQAASGHVRPSHHADNGGAVMAAARPADRAAALVARSNPEDLFEGSQHWASLAFR